MLVLSDHPAREKGATMVEFAIVIQLVGMLFLAVSEFTQVMIQLNVFTEALRRAGRVAAVATEDCESIAAATFSAEVAKRGYNSSVQSFEADVSVDGSSIGLVASLEIPCASCGIMFGGNFVLERTFSFPIEQGSSCAS